MCVKLLSLFLFFTTLFFAQTITIMIDPGHGGADPGNIAKDAKIAKEKDLNLAIAKKFGNYLSTKLSNVKIIYTRTDDQSVSLDSRVEMANSKKVDYFISVHCNSAPSTKISGTETHVHTMNSKKSLLLAKEFEKEFKGKAGRKSRGVKDGEDREHSIQVLKFTKMTSVLVECGFMSNVAEAKFLNSSSGQDLIASALFRGLRTFIEKEHPTIKFRQSSNKKESSTKVTSVDKNYTLQIYSSKTWMDTEKGNFAKLSKTVTRKENKGKEYKYTFYSGSFTSKEDAEKYLKEVREKGFKDAFIIETST